MEQGKLFKFPTVYRRNITIYCFILYPSIAVCIINCLFFTSDIELYACIHAGIKCNILSSERLVYKREEKVGRYPKGIKRAYVNIMGYIL